MSDENHELMGRYGAWGDKNRYGKITQGVLHSTVLIDPQGKVAHHWKNVEAAGHTEQVRPAARIASRQAHRPPFSLLQGWSGMRGTILTLPSTVKRCDGSRCA